MKPLLILLWCWLKLLSRRNHDYRWETDVIATLDKASNADDEENYDYNAPTSIQDGKNQVEVQIIWSMDILALQAKLSINGKFQ